jgi:hypothetical protein
MPGLPSIGLALPVSSVLGTAKKLHTLSVIVSGNAHKSEAAIARGVMIPAKRRKNPNANEQVE